MSTEPIRQTLEVRYTDFWTRWGRNLRDPCSENRQLSQGVALRHIQQQTQSNPNLVQVRTRCFGPDDLVLWLNISTLQRSFIGKMTCQGIVDAAPGASTLGGGRNVTWSRPHASKFQPGDGFRGPTYAITPFLCMQRTCAGGSRTSR